MIDSKIHEVNPNRVQWNTLKENDKQILIGLYKLKIHYNSQLDMVFYILGKKENLVNHLEKERLMNYGLSEEYFL